MSSYFLAAPAARGAEGAIPFLGQTDAIFVDGDPIVHWIGDPTAADAELVLVWTDSTPGAVNTLRTTHKIDARILTIGGGGAGGFGTTGSDPGAGGGGGSEAIKMEPNRLTVLTETCKMDLKRRSEDMHRQEVIHRLLLKLAKAMIFLLTFLYSLPAF